MYCTLADLNDLQTGFICGVITVVILVCAGLGGLFIKVIEEYDERFGIRKMKGDH